MIRAKEKAPGCFDLPRRHTCKNLRNNMPGKSTCSQEAEHLSRLNLGRFGKHRIRFAGFWPQFWVAR